MNIKEFRQNIGQLVKFAPTPQRKTLEGSVIGDFEYNDWFLVSMNDSGRSAEFLNAYTDHQIQIGFDSIREFRMPNLLFLRCRIVLQGKSDIYTEPLTPNTPPIATGSETPQTPRDRLNAVRLDRVKIITANKGPVPLMQGPKVILHLMTLSSLDSEIEWDLQPFEAPHSIRPIYCRSWSHRRNLDGLVSFKASNNDLHHSYVQVFRNGVIEACSMNIFDTDINVIPTLTFEEEIINSTAEYLNLLNTCNVPKPIMLFLSLMGVEGHTLGVSWRYAPEQLRIRENDLLFPGIRIDTFEYPSHTILRPAFDQLWNAAGREGSIYYDAKGNWTRHTQN